MTVTILADDLTGACDTGAVFTRREPVPVTVHPQRRAGAAVAVIDTESRSLPAGDARARLAAALAVTSRTELWFKKIDSTMRGPVAAELDALLGDAGAGVLLTPAFPAQGRTVRNRMLLVHGQPVAETTLARDPDFGLAGSDVVAALRATADRPIEWCPLADVRAGRVPDPHGAIVVCDAEHDGDLDTVVTAAMRLGRTPVLAGSAGLAGALARHLGLAGEPPALPLQARWLIVAGSRHPATAAQLAAARDRAARVVTPPPGPVADRHAVAAELARQARKIIDSGAVDLVAVTGGDTAVALYRELDADRIDLLGAPLPGLALGVLRRGDDFALAVLTKAGGFGAPDLYARLMP